MDDFASFARLVTAVDPWRGHLVLVGGWAHRLYRFHELADVPEYQPLTTKDTDFAFSAGAPLEGDIKGALEKAGFGERFFGESHPPVTHYELSNDDAGFYAEFLTPLVGSGRKRDGSLDATVLLAGVTAQKLRYLEILFIDPWVIRIGPDKGFPLPDRVDLQVANPASFIVQKLLIQQDRTPAKRAQDLLYIHDTLELCAGALGALKESWDKKIRPTMHVRTVRTAIELSVSTFSSVTDTIREAARMAPGRNLSPERLQGLCLGALREVIG
jgi:hypothetical protein